MIIFCGDPGYQLPPQKRNGEPVDWDKKELYHKEFKKNYRTKDEKLQKILDWCRWLIRQKFSTRRINELISKKLEFLKGTDKDYTVKDYIITGINERIKYFTKKHKDKGNKWLIKRTNGKHCAGDVIVDGNNECSYKTIPEHFKNVNKKSRKPASSELRHAFTAHATQGETITTKIYIDTHRLFLPQMFYTVLSRARHLSQIVLIDN